MKRTFVVVDSGALAISSSEIPGAYRVRTATCYRGGLDQATVGNDKDLLEISQAVHQRRANLLEFKAKILGWAGARDCPGKLRITTLPVDFSEYL